MTEPRKLLLDALEGRNEGRPAVWLMRQAGRYMPEYRALRQRHSFIEMCSDPDLAVEISLQPLRAFDVDAVIVFHDILPPLAAMGAPLEYTDEGPVLKRPVRDRAAVEELRELEPSRDSAAILESIRRLRAEVGGSRAVLGFAGAPFTLASYLIEGRVGARGVETLMRFLHEQPDLVHALLERLARMTARYLSAQAEAGADAVQLFDTWAGRLPAAEYRAFALPYQRRIVEAVQGGQGARGETAASAPVILYVRGSAHLVGEMAASGARAVSVDWRTPLREARERLGPRVALQGNLDPAALFAPAARVREHTARILEDRRGDRAYIFNLGHGILPETPVESVRALVETVRSWSPAPER